MSLVPGICRWPSRKARAAPTPAASPQPPAPARIPPAICTAPCTAAAASSGASRTPCPTPLLRGYCSCSFELFFQQLLLVQVRVISLARQQLFMRAALDQFAVLQYNDLIRFTHSRSAMRDQNRGPPAHH